MEVVAVHRDAEHRFSKPAADRLELVAGFGVAGDAHFGETVQHRSRVARDPSRPNLRQVHLIHAELFTDLAEAGHAVAPGDLGENVTTTGIDLLGLPTGAILRLGDAAVLRVTGLRNPCTQIDDFQQGLLRRVVGRADDGSIVRLAGVMTVVETSGVVRPGDRIVAELPEGEHLPLEPV